MNTQDRFCWEKPRSSWMRGSATPMIEVSMITMNWAVAMSARAHHRRAAGGTERADMSPPMYP
ncbi:hypothetical protein ACFQY7_03515 [Actinomadura luteofluorescens]|uniref:hypothetical protein n=1 Tax=Actinomadura luteofluorescens TaxID=46163 RepID=UPI00362D69F8